MKVLNQLNRQSCKLNATRNYDKLIGVFAVMLGVVGVLNAEHATKLVVMSIGVLLLVHCTIRIYTLVVYAGNRTNVFSVISEVPAGILLLLFPYYGITALTAVALILVSVRAISMAILLYRIKEIQRSMWIKLSVLMDAAVVCVVVIQWEEVVHWFLGFMTAVMLIANGIWYVKKFDHHV